MARRWYDSSLSPLSSSTEVKKINIRSGSTPSEIAKLLENSEIIRSANAFEAYIRSENISDQLKAGVFELSPSWTVAEIAEVLVSGKEASELFTIGPGLRLDQIKARLIKAGFTEPEIDEALKTDVYAGNPALVGKPESASLEGYLYPESFRIDASTTVRQLFEQSLGELSDKLTPSLIKSFNKQGLTTFEAITLASIIEKEVAGVSDRKQVAQVMLRRLNDGISLGADATYLYAAAVFGGDPFPNNDSPYNTRMFTGLPPGPISNVSLSSLEAVAEPAEGDYLFYVTGDNGKNYFTRTNAEHMDAIAKHCSIACAPGYIAPETP